jgi:hypothetical protein
MILIRFKGLSGPPDSQSHSDTPMHGAGSIQHDPTLSLLQALSKVFLQSLLFHYRMLRALATEKIIVFFGFSFPSSWGTNCHDLCVDDWLKNVLKGGPIRMK